MAFDNFTLRRYRALKECPQGQLPGDVFEATEDAGDILIRVDAAERVSDDTPLTGAAPKPRGSYKRRDLVAEPRR